MRRGRHCSKEEKSAVLILRKEGVSLRKIAEKVGRSLKLVVNAIKPTREKNNWASQEKRPSEKIETSFVYQKKSSKDIRDKLQLEVFSRTVRRRLAKNNLHGRIARRVDLLRKKI